MAPLVKTDETGLEFKAVVTDEELGAILANLWDDSPYLGLTNWVMGTIKYVQLYYFNTGQSGDFSASGAGELARIVIDLYSTGQKVFGFTYDENDRLSLMTCMGPLDATWGLEYTFNYYGATDNLISIKVEKKNLFQV
jgi:hypothetical protein